MFDNWRLSLPRDGFTLASVTSSEPDTGLGPDDRSGDIQDWNVGKPDTVGKLRAERAGDGPGREYRLTYVASDRAGNTTSCVAVVTVPHSHP